MSKLIKINHIYEIDFVKDISSFLVVCKNIFRIASKQGIREKKDGILIPVRWSYQKETFVVDRGTSLKRDLSGIDLNNLNTFYKKDDYLYSAIKFTLNTINNEKFIEIAKSLNLIKNTNKFIAFEYVKGKTNKIDNGEESIYFIGLFKFINCNKRKTSFTTNKSQKSLLLDYKIKEDLYEIKNIKKINSHFIKDHNITYLDFLSRLKNLKLNYKGQEKEIDAKSYIEKNVVINKNFLLKDYKKPIKSKTLNEKLDLSTLVLLEMSIFLCEFLKELFDLRSIEGFVIKDDITNDFTKVTGDFMLYTETFGQVNPEPKEEEIFYPLLPGVF